MSGSRQAAASPYVFLFQQVGNQSEIHVQSQDDPHNEMTFAVDLSQPNIKAIFDLVAQSGLAGLAQYEWDEETLFAITRKHWLALSLLDKQAQTEINQLSEIAQGELIAACFNCDTNESNKSFFLAHGHTQYPKHAVIKEKNGEGMSFLPNYDFVSWDGDVKNHYKMILMPESVEGLQNIVRYCRKENLRVRASGHRHSSSNLYAEDDAVCVAMINLDTATKLPAKFPAMTPNNDLQGIELVGEPYIKDGKRKIKCRIGSATCNYHFQEWVHAPQGGNLEWMLPLNVIMTEISFGGSNAPICHGAGVRNKTLSDLVTEIEFVNPKGEVQKITDKELIKTAAGCFGLLGLTTAITFELDEMQYANLQTVRREPLAKTIPPVADITQQVCNQDDFDLFVKRAEESDYAEWFWFPLQSEVWMNCWQHNGKKEAAQRFPGDWKIKVERFENYLAYLTSGVAAACPALARWQTKLLGEIALKLMLHEKNITCTVEDGLHFRHGLQNVPSVAMEFEIPIPNKLDGSPDYSVAQKAWWAVVDTTHDPKYKDSCPLRTSLEMRIMGGSDRTMAPQKGNERTAAIEVITSTDVPKEVWQSYCQDVLDKWSMLTDDQGNYLNIRTHWAKRFENLFINRPLDWLDQVSPEVRAELQVFVKDNNVSVPYVDYCKIVAFRNELTTFKQNLSAICAAGGYELKDIYNTFSNPLFDQLLSFPPRPKVEAKKSDEHKKPLKKFFEKFKECSSAHSL